MSQIVSKMKETINILLSLAQSLQNN